MFRINNAMEERDRKLSRGKTFFDLLPLGSCKKEYRLC
jgi:hypothetical protein